MNAITRRANWEYAALHAAYWAGFSVYGGMTSFYLLAHGFSNWEIGVIAAAGSLFSLVTQPFLADFADRSRRFTIINCLQGTSLLLILLSGATIWMTGRSVSRMVTYILVLGVYNAAQPLVNATCFQFQKAGVPVNFGTPRAIGSLSFSLFSTLVGIAMEKWGEDTLAVNGTLLFVTLLLVALIIGREYRAALLRRDLAKAQDAGQGTSIPEEEIGLVKFVSRNGMFVVMCTGILFIYYGNSAMNTYLPQLTVAAGGTGGDTGLIFAVRTVLEVPTMVLFSRLYARFRCSSMIKVAALFYILWLLTQALSPNVTCLVLSQLLQPFAFSLLLPAMVHFINDTMTGGEAVKGQSLFTLMTTAGTILSSLIGGAIIDWFGAPAMGLTCVGFFIIGAAIIFATIHRIKGGPQDARTD